MRFLSGLVITTLALACGGQTVGATSGGANDGPVIRRGGITGNDTCTGADLGTWVPLATEGDPGNTEGPPPLAVWTGTKILVIHRELSAAARVAAFDPCDNAWSDVPLDASFRRLGKQLSVIGGRVLMWHRTADYSVDQALLSDAGLAGFADAPEGLLPRPLLSLGDQVLIAPTRTETWVTFAEATLVDSAGAARATTGPAPSLRAQYGLTDWGSGVFVWGGWENPPGRYVADGAILDGRSATWTALPSNGAPSARRPAAVARIGNAVVVWGGRDQGGHRADGAVYDLDTGAWRPMSETDAPPPADDALIVATARRLFVLGGHEEVPGRGGVRLMNGASYDPIDDRWFPLALPQEVDSIWSRAHVLDDGRVLLRHRDLQWLALYEPAANQWTEIDPGPVGGRSNTAIAWTGRRLIVWGGMLLGPTQADQCQNVAPEQGCDPVGPERAYPEGGAMLAF